MFVDGLQEMQFGLVGLMMGAIFLAESWPQPWGRIFPIALAALSGLIRLCLQEDPVRTCFRRTGYVVFRQSDTDAWKQLWICVALLISFTAFLLASDRYFPSIWNVSGPLCALVIAAGFLWAARSLRFPHLNWLAGFSLVLGAAVYAAKRLKSRYPLDDARCPCGALVVSGAVISESF